MACAGGERGSTTGEPVPPGGDSSAPAVDPATGGPGALGALQAARKLEARTALFALNKALINFYVLNDRYPADLAELESAPEVAGAVADVEALADSLSYELRGDSYTVKVTLRGGEPLTLTGSDPGPRPAAPRAPPGP